jgi:hypothetical protein
MRVFWYILTVLLILSSLIIGIPTPVSANNYNNHPFVGFYIDSQGDYDGICILFGVWLMDVNNDGQLEANMKPIVQLPYENAAIAVLGCDLNKLEQGIVDTGQVYICEKAASNAKLAKYDLSTSVLTEIGSMNIPLIVGAAFNHSSPPQLYVASSDFIDSTSHRSFGEIHQVNISDAGSVSLGEILAGDPYDADGSDGQILFSDGDLAFDSQNQCYLACCNSFRGQRIYTINTPETFAYPLHTTSKRTVNGKITGLTDALSYSSSDGNIFYYQGNKYLSYLDGYTYPVALYDGDMALPVPEVSSMALFGLGVLALSGGIYYKKRRMAQRI